MSSIGDWTSRPNSSISRFDGSDRMAFLAIFLNISFLSLECHFETSFTSIFVGLYHGMRYGGIIL